MFRLLSIGLVMLRLVRTFSLVGAVVFVLSHGQEIYAWGKDLISQDPKALARNAGEAAKSVGDFLEQAKDRPVGETASRLARGTGWEAWYDRLQQLFEGKEDRVPTGSAAGRQIAKVPHYRFLKGR